MPSPVLTLPPSEAVSPVRAKALVFEDPLSRALLASIRKLAPTDATVLVLGETGTGKEIVARHLHQLSGRAARPFVAVNCGAFSETLVESELFGQERGAFTGAVAAKEGWFEAADGGTLFLDEIGDLPPATQVKLLRVLQEREVVRLGSRRPVKIDVRLIAATNVDLAAAVRSGKFREDLFYRLNVAQLVIPPLRERPEDIVPLARHFLESYSARLAVPEATFEPAALAHLVAHAWPGNIRELENVIHRALLVSHDGKIGAADLRLSAPAPPPGRTGPADTGRAFEAALLELFERRPPNLWSFIEATVMRSAFEYSERNQLETARLLGISRHVLRARLIAAGHLGAGSNPRSRPPSS